MKNIIMRWEYLTFIIVIFAILNSSQICAAQDSQKKSKVKTVDFKARKEKKFKTNESVFIKGHKFKPLTNVDIYVTTNRKWKKGDILNDESTDGVESVQTTSRGKIPKTRVWGAPIIAGKYDIIVDVNQDGTFNGKDTVDGKSRKRSSFKAKRFLP